MTLSYTHDMRAMLSVLDTMPEPETWEAKRLLRWLELEGTDVQSDYVQAHLERLGCGGQSLTWWALKTWCKPKDIEWVKFLWIYRNTPLGRCVPNADVASNALELFTERLIQSIKWSYPHLTVGIVKSNPALPAPVTLLVTHPDRPKHYTHPQITIAVDGIGPSWLVSVRLVDREKPDWRSCSKGPGRLETMLRDVIANAEQLEGQP